MRPKILIDTSVWVDLYRGKESLFNAELKEFIKADLVSTCDVIMAELLQGAASEKVYAQVSEDFNALHYLPVDQGVFEKAARLSFETRKRGFNVALTDSLIAAVAIEHAQILVTRDRDFGHFKNLHARILK